MLDNRKLIIDTHCEVYDLLKQWADEEFFDFSKHQFVPNAIYLIGREQFNLNKDKIKELANSENTQIILSNPFEGSETLKLHCENIYKIKEFTDTGKILLISGGDMDPSWPCLVYDSFLPKIFEYEENIKEIARSDEIYSKLDKPYKFLFLNGRSRHHRKYLLEKFRIDGILEQSLWTNLDPKPYTCYPFQLPNTDIHWCSAFPVQHLPEKYEVVKYRAQIEAPIEDSSRDLFLKHHLFNNEWGDIYLNAEPYIDTYFSLVTETVFEYPYSFRTEKICKPLSIGHPFIVASNYGYYRDLHNLGFKTFGHLIDESFDMIDNLQDRIDRISAVVQDLCKQDLSAFVTAAKETCKYNQQHLVDMSTKVRQEFPQRFKNFINERSRI